MLGHNSEVSVLAINTFTQSIIRLSRSSGKALPLNYEQIKLLTIVISVCRHKTNDL